MIDDNSILEFDFSGTDRRNRILSSILAVLFSLVILVLFTSYLKPDIRRNPLDSTYSINELSEELRYRLFSVVDSDRVQNTGNLQSKLNKAAWSFFDGINYQPVWTTDSGTNSNFTVLISLLDSAMYLGFPFDYFDYNAIQSLNDAFSSTKSLAARVDVERIATFTMLKFMLYLNQGVVENDSSINYDNYLGALPLVLNTAIRENNLKRNVLALQPSIAQYQKISNSLPQFFSLYMAFRGDTSARFNDEQLTKAIFYAGIDNANDIYKNHGSLALIHALQDRYNIPRDSALNKSTQNLLVLLLQYRYYQACVNLHRLRKLQTDVDSYLIVNIPEYKLRVVESGHEVQSYDVIVGKKETPTPIFTSSIEKIVANPTWTVPRDIVKSDMLSRIQRDSTYLRRNGFSILDAYGNVVKPSAIDWKDSDPLGNRLFIRQKNGTSNALGLLKIDFPNSYNIYIHDTPSKRLFQFKTRNFSHGCIRLANIDRLAQYLATQYAFGKDYNIKSLISDGTTQSVYLDRPVKIYIDYITCFGDDGNNLMFYSDIYDLDEKDIKQVLLD
ncbi:MAG: L,D-transpeptidase family protein [Bacteroidales bacterium]